MNTSLQGQQPQWFTVHVESTGGGRVWKLSLLPETFTCQWCDDWHVMKLHLFQQLLFVFLSRLVVMMSAGHGGSSWNVGATKVTFSQTQTEQELGTSAILRGEHVREDQLEPCGRIMSGRIVRYEFSQTVWFTSGQKHQTSLHDRTPDQPSAAAATASKN